MQKIPAVSVIIPLYNAEKYIGECLDSILAQTFQNFEVIVVDDCSTDNSVAVVKNYEPKFKGRLRLEKTPTNSGSPGLPGNMGVRFSRGEYLFILDNDDAILPKAIEKLYGTAKDFDADVVVCEKYYQVPTQFFNNAEVLAKIQPYSYQKGGFVDKPTLIENDVSKKVVACTQKRFLWNVWSKLIRRDCIMRNDLYFTENLIQDMLFTCCLIFSAERIVRVPYVVNRYRLIDDSLSHKKDSLTDYLKKHVRALRTGFEYLEKFLSVRPFFQQHPEFKYAALDICVGECLWYFMKAYGQIPFHLFDEAFRRELAAENFSSALTATILNKASIYRFKMSLMYKRIAELEKFATAAQKRIATLENEVQRLKT